MELNQSLEGKKIRLTDTDGEVFEGVVSDYIYSEDNEPEGIASIIIEDCPQRPYPDIEFLATDIKSIELIP